MASMADAVKGAASKEALDPGYVPDLTKSFLRKCTCIVYGCIFVGALVLYGMLQEKIMTIPYGPHNDSFFQFFKVPSHEERLTSYNFFRDAPFLVMWTRVVGTVVALAMIVVQKEHLKNQAPMWKYLLVAIAASIGSILQYESLKYLAFTVQILAKACKILPVLFWGRFINGKRYVLVDWIGAWLILAGSIVFFVGGPVDSEYSRGRSYWAGVGLLVLFVICDGIVGWYQTHLYKTYETSKYNQMFWINMTSALFCFIWTLISGQFFPSINMCREFPVLFADMSFMGGMGLVGQWCMYSIVHGFGAALFIAFLNVRLTISYVASNYFFEHDFLKLQLAALCIVGFALCFRSFVSLTSWWTEESESASTEEEEEEKPLLENPDEGPLKRIGRRLTTQVKRSGCGSSCFSMC